MPGDSAAVVASLRQTSNAEVEQSWSEAVERVGKWLNVGEEFEVQAAALHCLSSVVVPASSDQQLQTLSSTLLLKVSQLLTSAVDECSQQLAATPESSAKDPSKLAPVAGMCEHLQKCVTALVEWLGHVQGRLQASTELQPAHVSLVSTALQVTAKVLGYCKEVETQHAWAFNQLATQLGALFKATFSLLKDDMASGSLAVGSPLPAWLPSPEELASSAALDAVSLEPGFEEDQVTKLIGQLQSVCRAVIPFDASLLVLAWKAGGRLLCRVRPCLPGGWSVQSVIAGLCVAMETKALECVQNAPAVSEEAPSGAFSKLLKVCRFLATLLVKLVQEFEQSQHEFARDVATLLLSTYSSVPPSPRARVVSPAAQAELQSNVLLLGEPLVSAMLDCQEFLKLLVNRSSVSDSQQFGWAMTLCFLLKAFPRLPEGHQDMLMESDSSLESRAFSCQLLDAAFTCASLCYVGLQLPARVPGVMCNGQPQSAVTLHEHLCCHLCALVASLPPRHFHKLERSLLHYLLGPALCPALLACDVWCFLARWGTSELCGHHCHLLTKLLLTLPENPAHACPTHYSLVTRMVGFLSDAQQVEYVQGYPPTVPENIRLWAYLQLHQFRGALQKEIGQGLTATCLKVLSQGLQSSEQSHPTEALMVQLSLQGLVVVYSLPGSSTLLPPALVSSTVDLGLQAWASTVGALLEGQCGLPEPTVCAAIHLLSLLLLHLQPQHTIKVFDSLYELVSRGPPVAIALAAARFLAQCSGLQVCPQIQAQVLHSLAASFCGLLGHSHWLVHHQAMEAFRAFAEVTPYADSVEHCIPPQLGDIVVDFLNKVPYGSGKQPSPAKGLVAQLRERATLLQARRKETLAKGTSMEISTELCRDSLHLLCSSWEQLASEGPHLPEAVLREISRLCESMQQFVQAARTPPTPHQAAGTPPTPHQPAGTPPTPHQPL